MSNRQKYTFKKALIQLERFCAYQERCELDVRQKLNRLGVFKQDQQKILAHLKEYDFLNEQRFVAAFVQGKFRIKKWGRQKIKAALKAKGLEDRLIEEALAEIPMEQYREHIGSILEKKKNTKSNKSSYELKAYLFRHLAGKGYEPAIFGPILEDYIKLNKS